VKREAEIRGLQPQANEYLEPQKVGLAKNVFFYRAFRRKMALWHWISDP
jgi:hypothetical protein